MGLHPLWFDRLVPLKEKLASGSLGFRVYLGTNGRNILEAVDLHLTPHLRSQADFYWIHGFGSFFGMVFKSVAQIRMKEKGVKPRNHVRSNRN